MKKLENPMEVYPVKKLLNLHKEQDTKRKQLPINKNILRQLLARVKDGDRESFYKSAMYITYFLMYHLALRISEICNTSHAKHAITLKDIKIHKKSGVVEVTLFTYKHSKEPVTYDINKNERFLNHLEYYIRKRGSKKGQFMIHKSGAPFSRNYVADQLKLDIQGIGLNPNLYNTHGFRHGRASDLAQDGKSDRQIAAIGRWNSNAFQNYITTERVTV